MDLNFTDLDESPERLDEVVELFRAHPPGREHAVCGEPSRMGRTPQRNDLLDCLGILIALVDDRLVGALAVCPYSDNQVTIWGPVVASRHRRRGIGRALMDQVRIALADGSFDSLRILVDTRNRVGRSFVLSRGLSAWKDDCLYECDLADDLPVDPGGIGLAQPSDHDAVADLLLQGFPETGHCEESLAARERQGYRHYVLQDSGRILGAAAAKEGGWRSWLSLIAVRREERGRGLGRSLLAGLMVHEARKGSRGLALEVLADNQSARRLFTSVGFRRRWCATIFTGPV